MIRTRVGYAGGTQDDPDYYNLGDHTECLRVEYDSEEVTYDELLREFWQRHDPIRQSPSRQYENLLLYASDRQRERINRSVCQYLDLDSETPATRIDSLDTFYPAEDYHQNYYLRSAETLKSLVDGSSYNFVRSILATKLNAFAGNQLVAEKLKDQLCARGVDQECLVRLNSLEII